jgi:uncharacterized hydrophobic protein (TIGR00271 family)
LKEKEQPGSKNIKEQVLDQSNEKVKKGSKAFFTAAKVFMIEILDVSHDTDKAKTMEMIRKDIPFKGHNAWILICSIMIASVGLNANSPAVVIGAMLISPLMAPILGIGMAIAINDIDTLNRSLANFAVMVGLSIVTAFIFFALFPLKIESSELLARTSPDVRDVLIAFFGGLALIIARTKTGTIASVIFGVAIATALMPPLCAAGYGLAVGNLAHFWGAMYLFTINTIFIAFATYIVLKLLNFPMERYANSVKRRRIAQAISVVAFLIIIPAIWTFYNVFQKSLYMRQAEEFVENEVKKFEFEDGKFIPNLTQYNYHKNGESSISLVFLGKEVVTSAVEKTWANKLADAKYNKLKNTRIDIAQGSKDEIAETAIYIEKLYEEASEELVDKEEEIENLQSELKILKNQRIENIPFDLIYKECEALFPEMASLSYNTRLVGNKTGLDTSLIFITTWNEKTDTSKINDQNTRLRAWLKRRLDKNNIQVSSQ